jgi:general secretion pathway protein A
VITRDARASQAPVSEATRHQLVTTLHQFLASLISLNAHAVIMIDEAQHLTAPVLEQIRLLSNFETDRSKLLQIVLVGQPNLETMLRQPDLRQLDQRVARRIQLQPLSADEVREYISRRLAVASAPAMPFTPAALDAIRGLSQGVPRVVNTLCDRTLEIGCERRLKTVDRDVVHAAADRLKLSATAPPSAQVTLERQPRPLRKTPPAVSAAAAAALAIVLGGTWWMSRRAASSPAAPSPARATPQPQASTTPPAPVPSNRAAGTAQPPAPTATATPPSTAAPSVPAQPPPKIASTPPNASTFRIAVAAFRTSKRAMDVATDIATKGLPVSTHLDSTGQWYQVVVGPSLVSIAEDAVDAVQHRRQFAERIKSHDSHDLFSLLAEFDLIALRSPGLPRASGVTPRWCGRPGTSTPGPRISLP